MYLFLYITLQYIMFIVYQDFDSFYLDLNLASDPDFSKQKQKELKI